MTQEVQRLCSLTSLVPGFPDVHDDQVLNAVSGHDAKIAPTFLKGSEHSILTDLGFYLSQDFLLQRIQSLRMDRPISLALSAHSLKDC